MIIGMSETLTPAKGEICENLWELSLYRTHVNYTWCFAMDRKEV